MQHFKVDVFYLFKRQSHPKYSFNQNKTYYKLIMSKNPYQILHLEEDATYDQIKEKYRHLTKNLHPDKQPLENYQVTKRLFQQIDEAYKSISSPLRRFLFRQYGLPALKMLDQAPGMFQEFDVEVLNNKQIKKLKQLMVFLLYEREANLQMDKTKFITKMLMNITKTIKGRPKNIKKISKRNHYLPEIENCTFEYEMVLPELYGFSNSFAISQTTTNIKNDPKYLLNFAFSSVRRIKMNYMLAIQSNFSTQDSNMDIGIDRICQNNLHLKFTPISIVNWKFGLPKYGVQKSFNNYQISTVTDLNSINFDYSESSSKKIGKSLKLFMDRGSIGLIPKVEFQVNPNLRLFIQLSTAFDFNHKENDISIRPSLTYGYKLIVSEDLKIELASCLGAPNYFQLSFISTKYRVSIPMITAETELIKFEAFKLSTMILTLLIFEGVRLRNRKNQSIRQKTIKQNQTRINDLKRQLNRHINDVQMSSQQKRQKQIQYNGLIIIKAYIGESSRINKIAKKVKKIKLSKNLLQNLSITIAQCEHIIFNLRLPVGEINDEVQEIGSLIQNQVRGGLLFNFNLQGLRKYSPALIQQSCPDLFIAYFDKGQFKTVKVTCKGYLSIGQPEKRPIKSALKYLANQLINCIF